MKLLILSLLSTLGFNLQAKDITSIDKQALKQLINSDNKPIIIDVRTVREYDKGHIPGAINMPHGSIGKQIDQVGIAKDAHIVIYCRSGYRAKKAYQAMAALGYVNLQHLEGDYLEWKKPD